MDATAHKCQTFAYDEQRGYWRCTECGAFEDLNEDYDEGEGESFTCPHCNGTGLDFDGLEECEHCDGMGYKWWL